MTPILQVANLKIQIHAQNSRPITLLDGIRFDLNPGEILGIIGEPQCGKTTLANSCCGTIQSPAILCSGQILCEGNNILELSPESLRMDIHGKRISLISSDSLHTLDPTQNILQVATTILKAHDASLSPKVCRERLTEHLQRLGLAPHLAMQLPKTIPSETQVALALALATLNKPKVLILDRLGTAPATESTAALIALIQRMLSLGIIQSTLWLTSYAPELEDFAQRIGVLYAGEILEIGTADQILFDPKHPFTRMILSATTPSTSKGSTPDLSNPPSGCRFAVRCPVAGPECTSSKQILRTVADRDVKCMYAQ